MIRLHLASSSPRRQDLLREAGIDFELLRVDVDETPPEGVDVEQTVAELAARKAQAGRAQVSEGWVLGADTLVALDGAPLGKPRDREEARRMLAALSGRSHQVLTGVALVSACGSHARQDVASTRVRFRDLAPAEIDAYVASGEADDKAGAYAIQGGARSFVAQLDGSLSNVVGLPLDVLERQLTWARSIT